MLEVTVVHKENEKREVKEASFPIVLQDKTTNEYKAKVKCIYEA